MTDLAGRYFAVLSMFCMIFSGFVVMYWSLIDVKPPSVQKTVSTFDVHGNSADTFHPGDILTIRRDSCVVDEGDAVYTRALVRADQTEVYFMHSGPMYLTPGCRTAYNQVQIPTFTSAGEYDYVVRLSFKNNPLTTSHQTFPIVRIKVVP
jgi:hypothetical protein